MADHFIGICMDCGASEKKNADGKFYRCSCGGTQNMYAFPSMEKFDANNWKMSPFDRRLMGLFAIKVEDTCSKSTSGSPQPS